MAIAGLWSSWKLATGEWMHSFTMLTINAEHHLLMKQSHEPADEKRMLVSLLITSGWWRRCGIVGNFLCRLMLGR